MGVMEFFSREIRQPDTTLLQKPMSLEVQQRLAADVAQVVVGVYEELLARRGSMRRAAAA